MWRILMLIGVLLSADLMAQDIQVGRAPRRELKRRSTVALDGSGHYSSIQAAIDASEFNATITIKEGVYRERIILKSFVNLRGDGTGRTIMMAVGHGPVIEAVNVAGGLISDITVLRTDTSTGPLVIARYANFSLERCSFKGGANGVHVLHKSSVNIRDCQFDTFSEHAILYKDRSHGYVINSAIRRSFVGILVEDGASPTVERNTIFDSGKHGVWLRTNSTNKIIGNFIANSGSHGILVESNSSPLIRNNTIDRSGRQNGDSEMGFGISIQNTSAVSLINNCVSQNEGGIGALRSHGLVLSTNNLWLNDTNYVGIPKGSADLAVDPQYKNARAYDFTLEPTSPIYRKGEDGVSIGADFDNTRLEKKKRLSYLKTTAARELSQGNYHAAHQSAMEILTIDKEDMEGISLKKKAGEEIAKAYLRNATVDFNAENYRIAENYVRAAINFDPDNMEAKELAARIQEYYDDQKVVTISYVAIGLLVVGFGGWWWRKQIVLGEIKRQVRWWLDDAREQLEIAISIHGEQVDPDGLRLAKNKLEEANRLYEEKSFEACEHACNESCRYSARVKDEVEKQRRIRQDALLEVANAEETMNLLSKEAKERFPADIRDFEFYLQRAQDAIRGSQYLLAKEISEDLQSAVKRLEASLSDEHVRRIKELISDTESMIVEALATNTNPEIIAAVIDFRSELEVLRNGVENGKLSLEEVEPQIRQVRDFVLEVQRLSGSGQTAKPFKARRSYYEILGVKEDATLEQIKVVYRKLSMIYHPDMNAGDELGIAGDERFKEIKEAYDSLTAEKMRAQEDR